MLDMPCDDKLIIYDGDNNNKRIRINIETGRRSAGVLLVDLPSEIPIA